MAVTLVDPTRQPASIRPDAHILISTVRNESLRLPYFLTYYRTLGFEHFLLIDNDSSDGTREFLMEQTDVTLYHTADSFKVSRFGQKWMTSILETHGHEGWVLLADADELLVWPGSEHETIRDLTGRMDQMQAGGLFALMVDMYSDRPFGEVGYVRGTPFLEATPFFDRGQHMLVDIYIFPHHMILGGLRGRNFNWQDDSRRYPPIVSKVPLLRWQRGQRFGPGGHTVIVPVTLAPMRGALLHFKLFDDAPAECAEEVARGEHHKNAQEYKALALAIEQAPNHCFFDRRYSVRYEGTSQLVSLGIMHDQNPLGGLPNWNDQDRGAEAPGPGTSDPGAKV